jgi:hypothetical protein
VELEGEGAENLCHHDVVQSSLIDGWIDDVGEDVVVEGVATKHEKHVVVPPLVVGRGGFQNDRDHRSYILEADSVCVQVRGEGGVGVGADVDRAIVVVVLGDRDPLGSGELLFQVTGDGLLLFPSEGGRAHASFKVLHVVATAKTRASCSRCAIAVASSSFLLAAAAAAAAVMVCCSSTERLEVLPGMVGKTVVVRGGGGWRRMLRLGQR